MTQPNGQTYVKVDGPGSWLCDICTGTLDGAWHVATSVGGAGQSFVCQKCADAFAKIVNGERMKAARAARKAA